MKHHETRSTFVLLLFYRWQCGLFGFIPNGQSNSLCLLEQMVRAYVPVRMRYDCRTALVTDQQALIKLGRKLGIKIPPIQCLVVNQVDELPGEGVDSFIEKEVIRGMTKPQRRAMIGRLLQEVFTFARWDEVLAAFGMKPAPLDYSKLLRNVAGNGRGGGESEHHIRLKQFVASRPDLLGLPKSVAKGVNEYRLPSGDELDVLFREGDEWIAVEVKSHISSDEDLVRGFFQCIKYQAVLEAFLFSTSRPPEVRTVLVITRKLPGSLLSLKNFLGIEVIQIDEPPEPQSNQLAHA